MSKPKEHASHTGEKTEANDQDAYLAAKHRVEAKMAFYIHLLVYVAVNALLVAIYVLSRSESLWFVWPLGGWGIAVVIHALTIFVFSGKSSLKQRMIAKELARRQAKN